MVKLFLKRISVFIVILIAIFNVVQFHHHDCWGKVCLPSFYEHIHEHDTHKHEHSHTHDCDDMCPIVDLEAINVEDVSFNVKIDSQDVFYFFYNISNVQFDIIAISAFNIIRADYIVPIKHVILCNINQYRGSPFFA